MKNKHHIALKHFLNNSEGRDHQRLFGKDAFFDLDATGTQARSIRKFRKGEECVVLTVPSDGVVHLAWYRFDGFRSAIDPKTNQPLEVLFGKKLKVEEEMTKTDAFNHELYVNFFRISGPQRGGFKLYCVSHAKIVISAKNHF